MLIRSVLSAGCSLNVEIFIVFLKEKISIAAPSSILPKIDLPSKFLIQTTISCFLLHVDSDSERYSLVYQFSSQEEFDFYFWVVVVAVLFLPPYDS